MAGLGGFRTARIDELDELYALEEASYPADEAATRAKLELRLTKAGEYFYVLRESGEGPVVGYVCGTRATALTEESMAVHDPEGAVLCVHSVVVAPSWRRKGLAAWMVRLFCSRVERLSPSVREFALLSKEANRGLYERCGFSNFGPSGVDHGADVWLLMRRACSEGRGPPLSVVDAFTSKPIGGGNTAGVVVLASPPPPAGTVVHGTDAADAARASAADAAASTELLPGGGPTPSPADAWMQAVAIELGFAETAFVAPLADGSFSLRWFTPGGEVDLCGHATLASAHALLDAAAVPPGCPGVAFASRSGRLAAAFGDDGTITLDFPAEPPAALEDAAERDAIVSAVVRGLWPTQPGRADGILGVLRNRVDVLVEVTREAFDAAAPRPGSAALAEIDCRGVIVTAAGGIDSEG